MNNKKDRFNKIKTIWFDFKSNHNKIRIKDASDQLKISEAELLSTEIDNNTFLLDVKNFNDFFQKILSIKKIMLLVRNDSAVHEKNIQTNKYIYKNEALISKNGSIILDIKINYLKFVFYQKKMHRKSQLRSFQIFDNLGNAVIKIYLKSDDCNKFDEIAFHYKTNYEYQLQLIDNNNQIHKQALAFSDLRFYFNNEKQILNTKTILLKNDSFRKIINKVIESNIMIQIIVIGLNAIQYHQDNIKKIVDIRSWFNILDQDFNLHLIEKNIYKIELDIYDDKFSLIKIYDINNMPIIGLLSAPSEELQFLKIIKEVS